jgi:hypothetical protein
LSGANRSVRSRRASSSGNLRLAALKWLDMSGPPTRVFTGPAARSEREYRW